MSAIHWILLALGTWFLIIATLRVCAADTKSCDRLQSELLAAGRRAHFANPEPRQRQFGG